MQIIPDTKIYKENFSKSLGSLFREFYSSEEIAILEKEIREKYLGFKGEKIEITIYNPGLEDPLYRRQHKILLISCDSLPFFASRVRKAFELLHLEVSRSLHFHPQEGKELYYIEVQGAKEELLEKLSSGLITSYSKIRKLTISFQEYIQHWNSKKEKWDPPIRNLMEWLMEKSYVWEGCVWEEGGEKSEFGNIDLAESERDWFSQRLPPEGTERIHVEASESNQKSFLGDERYFYIAFTSSDFKVLLIGSLNQFAKASALVDIPYFNERFKNFLKTEGIEPISGLGRTTRMMFNYIPTEIIFLLPQSSYIKIQSALMEQNLRGALRSSGVVISEELGLIISFVPENNWSEITWEASDRILNEIFPDSQIHRYFVMRGNFVESFHLIRSESMSHQTIFDASSRVEFSFRSWKDHLAMKWEEVFKTDFPGTELEFHDDYKATHTPELCIHDLKMLEAMGEGEIQVELTKRPDTTILHAVTPRMRFHLSQWVRILNDMGLTPISQRVYHFDYQGKTYAKSEFFFHHIENKKDLYGRIKKIFQHSMLGKMRSDSLSELVLWSSLDANGIYFAKAIRDYCLQSSIAFNPDELNGFLVDHSGLVEACWEYFVSFFQNGVKLSDQKIMKEADLGKTIREDDALYAYATTVLSILRTNFFGSGKDLRIGIERESVSFKIDSSIPRSLPSPRPFRDTFVYSSLYQGIHLRGGAVARGGIRWSDRISDYRTELLSLLKTQMVKNSIIVPVGSKGSFVVTPNSLLKLELPMVEAYKGFISGMLDLVDNREKGEIIPYDSREGSIPFALDDPDPYLVVAADKGTAQLSDTANALSESYGYWLGDAFASGGSRGYSHKKYGITARGALVASDRNLRLEGIDFRKETITVVGIGDMGGDVFGNGLLDSEHFQLIAAFNHKHIFIDPNPDPKISFEERKRLFESDKPGWDFYNKNLISQGGGIWNRTEKSIPISAQAREVLGVEDVHLSGSELIQAILKAPVDLFYNGGIGTYVKSTAESNSQVGDPANNDVRVNGSQLRCKVVSEGGNLGFTQKARIEFDLSGGKIFTDAVDNSAGVDLSDHEVNLKIFMNHLLENGHLSSLDERDKLMKKIDEDVVQSVLLDNDLQSLSINVDSLESELDGWHEFISASEGLVERGVLEPEISCVPARVNDWEEWKPHTKRIPRPVLATLMGHLKMELYSICLESEVFPAEDFEDLYLGYFPIYLQERYREDLFRHPLKLEISTTRAVNFLVNLNGIRLSSILPQEKSKKTFQLRKILIDLTGKNINTGLDFISRIRDKTKERDIENLVLSLRKTVRMKWAQEEKPDPSWLSSWKSVIPEDKLTGITEYMS